MEKERKLDKDTLGKMLLDAAEEGRLSKLKKALKLGADVNATDEHRLSALHIAAFYLNREAAKFLVANGADINAKGKYGWAPLHIAAIRADKVLAKLLIANGADVNARDDDQLTPLHRAVIQSSKEVAWLLIRHGADINAKSKEGWTPLHIAIIDENKELAQLLLVNGAEVNARDEKGGTPLHYVAASNTENKELAELLANSGADPKIKDTLGMSPLDYGSKEMNELIRTVIISKMLFNVVLFAAVEKGNIEGAKNALSLGADINAQDEDGWTPLHIAAIKANKVLANLLVESGAKPDIKDNFGRVPLDYGGEEMKESIRSALEKIKAMDRELEEDGNSFAIKNIWKNLRRQF